MITCDYSYAPDCSQCDEPICRRDIYHGPNDWDEPLFEPSDYYDD